MLDSMSLAINFRDLLSRVARFSKQKYEMLMQLTPKIFWFSLKFTFSKASYFRIKRNIRRKKSNLKKET